ncbi:putative transposase OrfB [Piscirickettsia salmonis]|nr:putative transposase OrfB [Piscirickettsia salmonis]
MECADSRHVTLCDADSRGFIVVAFCSAILHHWMCKIPTEVATLTISMDGKGRATDNIAIERFWRSAKYENIYLSEYANIKELKAGVTEYIEFYNNKRFHQTLDYKKPMDVYCNLQPQLFLEAA